MTVVSAVPIASNNITIESTSQNSNSKTITTTVTTTTTNDAGKSRNVIRKKIRSNNNNTTIEVTNGGTTTNAVGFTISCGECNRDFSKTLNPKKRLREHVRRMHLKNGKFQCDNCPKTFVCRQGLRDHEPVHSKERNHSCAYCGQTFLRLSHLYMHTRTHEEEKNFRCEACFFTFAVQSELKEHCEVNHNDITIDTKCSVCKQNLFSGQSIYSHSLRHSGTRDWKCDVCGAAFKRKQILEHHKKRHNTMAESKNSPSRQQEKNSVITCDLCINDKEIIPGADTICEHQSLHKENPQNVSKTKTGIANKGNKCEVCGKVFKNWGNYNRHINLHPKLKDEIASIAKEQENELDKEKSSLNEEMSCKACPSKFNNSRRLLNHLREHQQNTNTQKQNNDSNRDTFCAVCNRSFTCSGYLKKHMEMHGTIEMKCDVCLMIFKRRDTLRIHKKRHLQRNETFENFKVDKKGEIYNKRKEMRANIGEPDADGVVPCPYCLKKFNKRKLLLAHIVVHSGVLFNCDVCGKKYKQRSCLNKHKQSHVAVTTEQKPDDNPVVDCNEGKTQESVPFTAATRTVTKVKYKCSVCTQGFPSIKVLSEHEVSHKTLRINCNDCELAFLSNDDFELHIRLTHTNKSRRNNPKTVNS